MNGNLLLREPLRVLAVICFLFLIFSNSPAQDLGDPQFIRAEVRGTLNFRDGHGYFVEVSSSNFLNEKTEVWLRVAEDKVLVRRLQSVLRKTVIVRGRLEQFPSNVTSGVPPGGIYMLDFEINLAPPLFLAIWFAPINDPNKPAWEILPQEAKPGEVILSKRNELGILSNFAPTPFVYHGKKYASLEGFWQMMLYPEGPDDPRAKAEGVEWKYTRDQVAQMTAFEAKAAGTLAEENMKKLGIDWVSFEGKRFPYRSAEPGEHYRLIVDAMRAKLEQNPEVKRILLATGDLTLRPDHHEEQNASPEWHYYEIWMRIRAEIQAGINGKTQEK